MSVTIGNSICWPLERAEDDVQYGGERSWRLRWLRASRDWIVLSLAAVLTGITGKAIIIVATWLATLREGYCSEGWYKSRSVCCSASSYALDCEAWHYWPSSIRWLIYIGLSCIVTFIAAISVAKVAPLAAMSGLPEIRTYADGYDVPGLFSLKTLIVKGFGLCLVLASGLWLGIEAPMVHVASCYAALLARVTRFNFVFSQAKSREIIMAVAASGISVAFGAPIGGLLFVLEAFAPPRVVVWQGFVCAMLGTFVVGRPLKILGVFKVGDDRIWHTIELIPFALLGILGGIYGALAIRLNAFLTRKIPATRHWLVATVVAIACSGLSYITTLSRIPHSQLLSLLFAECRSDDISFLCERPRLDQLIFTWAIGATMTPLMFGLTIPSGILLPSILTGALGGRLMGLVMQQILEKLPGVLSTKFCPDSTTGDHCITPGVYAVAGAAAVLTGFSRLTISSVVILFELTGALSFVVPIMVGVMVSKWVGDALGNHSIGDSWIKLMGLPSLGTVNTAYPEISARDIMVHVSELQIVAVDSPLPQDMEHRGVPVVGPGNIYIDYQTLGGSEPVMVLSPDASLFLIVSTFKKIGVRVIIFCDRGELCGLTTRRDIVRVLRKKDKFNSGSRGPQDDYELELATELEPLSG